MTRKAFVLSLAVGAALAAIATSASAGGFAIGTQSGSGTGNAFAGGAAAAEDASVAWYNPAGLSLLPVGKHVSLAGHLLRPSFKFRNEGSTGAFAGPGTGEGGDGGGWALVPNGHFAMDLDPRWRFGFALTAPFGLKTEYDDGWRGQLVALKSEIKTVNLNPSVAYRLSDTASVGAGVSVQMLEAELTRFAGGLGISTLEADDVGYGFNLGIMLQMTPSTRVGATYRSSIKYDLEGTASFSGSPTSNAPIGAGIRVPDSASLSVFSVASPQWEFMADVTWTGWSTVKRLQVICGSTSALVCPSSGATLSTLTFNWKDTWRLGAGANYRLDSRTKLRFGVAWDETPTNDVDRTPRLPDQDRLWIAFGVQYRMSQASVLEAGYAHEFVRDARVNNTEPPAPGALVGTFKNKADIFSLQYSHSF